MIFFCFHWIENAGFLPCRQLTNLTSLTWGHQGLLINWLLLGGKRSQTNWLMQNLLMFGLLKDISFPQQPPIYHQALIYRLGISGDNNKIWRRKNLPFFGRKWGVECCYHHQHFAALPLMTDHGNLDLHGKHLGFWANSREPIFKLKFLKSGLKYKLASF